MVFDLVIETHILSVIPKLIQINVIPCNIFITVPGRFAPNPVRPDSLLSLGGFALIYY